MRRLGVILIFILVSAIYPAIGLGGQPEQRVVEDMLGRKVTLPQKVKRIVPLGGAMRFVVYLNAFDLVVGVEGAESRLDASSLRPYGLAIHQAATHLPVIGEGWQKPVNVEAVMTVHPDLIITAGFDAAKANDLAQKTGVPVLGLGYGGSAGFLDMNEVIKALTLMGRVLGREQRTQEVVSFIDTAQKDILRRIGPSEKGGPSVYVGCLGSRGTHGITSTDANYFPLEAVRGNNVAKGLGQRGHLFIDKEQLLVWNPSIILVDAGGLTILKEDCARNRDFYDRLDAVKQGRVYTTPPYNYYYTNVEIALANAYFTGHVLYPEKFADLNPGQKADEIFRFFTGVACYDQMRKEFGGYQQLQFVNGVINAH
ncbi:MAG: ABC transporter substrate-binding protein [Deltaproteobacteria bacterium]|nr:ABC transporter substrate-binding protein [Deltaproteobacteria bacterium]MBF0524821.1 ABC transporter substrate-binding protein [Deltaproteobacteria bacterium]